MPSILIIEDEKAIVELLQAALKKAGFKVAAKRDGATGLAQLHKSPPDVLILDLGLPRVSGLDILRAVRREAKLSGVMVLILTGMAEEADRVVGLELGADDYLAKPFSVREVVARVRALLRRAELTGQPERVIRIGELLIDPNLRRVTLDSRPVPMSAMDFRLLYFLASHPNRVFSREELLKALWGEGRHVVPRVVDTYFWRLRRKLEADPQKPVMLKSSRGSGYLLEIPTNLKVP